MSNRSNNPERSDSMIGVGIAIGTGVGAALGVAMDNIAVGVAVGIAIGAAVGAILQQQRNKPDANEGDDFTKPT